MNIEGEYNTCIRKIGWSGSSCDTGMHKVSINVIIEKKIVVMKCHLYH